ncbi:hypothetical protein [Ammoniphilus sp. 3BR4]|uniref:hypothetical protein n=1 Tax=Ammoniphilus sp. 3BR4 TaxID=3158265 RepID=UPI00346520C2
MEKKKDRCRECNKVVAKKYHKATRLCSKCRNKRIAEKKAKDMKNDPARYLLYQSCKRAVERGGEKCKKSTYQNVSCHWSKPMEMLNALMQDRVFWEAWQEQTEIYITNGQKDDDRPTIDRIDESGHYEIGNLQVLPQRLNAIKGSSNQCLVFLIKGVSLIKVIEFASIKEAHQALGIPYSVVNSGGIYDLRDGYKALIESPKSVNRVSEKPRYLMVVNYRQHVIDDEGNRYEIQTQEQKLVNAIRLTEVQAPTIK